MIGFIVNRHATRLPAIAMLAGVAFALTGCGGGGGGGSTPPPANVVVTGTLKDSIDGTALPGHIVKIQGTALVATATAASVFSIANVPSTGTIVLAVYESNGTTLDGTRSVNLSAISVTSPGGVATKNVGTITVPASSVPPPPPPI